MELSKKDILTLVGTFIGVALIGTGVSFVIGEPEMLKNIPLRELAGFGLIGIGVAIAAVANVKGME